MIDESVAVLDEILLDPVFSFTLQLAYQAKISPDVSFDVYIEGGEALLSFLEKERMLMGVADFSEDHVQRVIEETRRIVEDGLEGFAGPEDVFKAIVRLKFALLQAREAEQVPGWVKAAKALTMTLGGAVLVSLNATGWAASMGISGPLTALSAAAGGTILGEGAKDLLGFIPE